ncbi:MAG TPA: HPr kinase/phosphatase C-terminal domain-containing protein [Xanthobacteraceae bacterium]|nr:HPr kinase/phosphatase C-terminal domain-containing protein [Xanthobacteraceae bacterium]
MTEPASAHGSCVSVGGRGLLIRGPSGAGKSRLAFALILAGRSGLLPPTLLVADDRVLLVPRDGRLYAHAPLALAGLIEVRGAGLRRMESLAETPLDLVVDLAAADGARLPEPAALWTQLGGVMLARLPLAPGFEPLAPVLAALLTQAGPN